MAASVIADFAQKFVNPSASSNISDGEGAFSLPGTVLETVVPGYGIIRKVALDVFKVDISMFVSLVGLFFLLRTAWTYISDRFTGIVDHYFLSYVEMSDTDDIFDSAMKFLVKQGSFKRTRSLKIAGRWWDNALQSPRGMRELSVGLQPSSDLFNYDTTNKQIGYEPDEGTYRFWHKARLYFINIRIIKHPNDKWNDTIKIRFSCYSFTPKPLKDLIEEIRKSDLNIEDQVTAFFRADTNGSDWRHVTSRPSRPLNTVTLDAEQKTRIVRDMNDFIQPARARWYSNRGIPYRRGYLFHGAPGCGKSSLSLALAGVFGLSLYAVSLQDSKMTEEKLMQLFDYLPEKCIVLLEDIDSAGITASRSATPAAQDRSEKDSNDQNSDDNSGSRLSLAGLLNVIDGVSSHEGHVLIMTTNHPEKLDAALKRPGRVDMQIKFTLATKTQAREIFLRMYTDEMVVKQSPDEKRVVVAHTVEEVCRERSDLRDTLECPFGTMDELYDMADKFVEDIPSFLFSPAEVQGYLLMFKDSPQEAVAGVAEWVRKQQEDSTPESIPAAVADEAKAAVAEVAQTTETTGT